MRQQRSIKALVARVNLKGAFLTTRAALPHMIERPQAALVFMASTKSSIQEERTCAK